jgi:tight adherence protein B
MEDLWIIAGLFVFILLLIELLYYGFKGVGISEKSQVQKRLRLLSVSQQEKEQVSIVKTRIFSRIPWLNQVLSKSPAVGKMSRLLEQADSKLTPGLLITLSLLLALFGLLLGFRLGQGNIGFISYLIAIIWAVILGFIPYCWALFKKKKRMKIFQAQLPEALDLIARSLRAGHAFTGGLKMVGDEMNDPIGGEFLKTLSEINLGVGVQEALINLAGRVDCPDLKFFITSVIIQRETGGNLAEILENLAHLIRERFKFYGKVQTLAAPGKLSAIILVILPFALAFVISQINPKYMQALINDPAGKYLIGAALLLMAVGTLFIKKLIAIKV